MSELQKAAVAEANRRTKFKHGGAKNPLYTTWLNMRQRCNNPRSPAYKNYGGRGIKVCERWDDFLNFAEDMGDRPEGMTLERIDCNGDYSPENCKWATRKEQMRNVRYNRWIEFDGKRLILSDWSKELGISPATLWYRLSKYEAETALTMKR